MPEQALQQTSETIGEQATRLQHLAADPTRNVWVNASAGTGKTKVLTERVLRLLLPLDGRDATHPENILCVTFTKAGASEMIDRLMKILSEWAVCDEKKLNEKLTELLGCAPSIKQRDTARQLFAKVIDLQNGLNVTTIHALCQSILGRFTLEAGLPPNFNVMEEAEAKAVLHKVRNALVRDILEEGESHRLYDAFSWLASIKNSDQINKIFAAALNDRKKLGTFFDTHPDYKHDYRTRFQIGEDETEDRIIAHAMTESLPEADIRDLAKAFEHGSPTNRKNALTLYDILNSEKTEHYETYKLLFLTKDGTIRSEKAVSKGAQEAFPQSLNIFMTEAERLLQTEDRLKTLMVYRATIAILDMTGEIIARYQATKFHLRKLDYDDLIHKTHALLSGTYRQWVLFKLDYAIEHILVDEAQDTSPDQWGILEALWDDFFSGHSAKDEQGKDRTVFVVGDNKQSIFSFQGANLETFNAVHDTLMTSVKNGSKPWEDVPMTTSFRSTSAVLDIVDHVYNDDALRRSLTQNPDHYNTHIAHRQGHAGCVELWPLYKSPDEGALPPWSLPLHTRNTHDAKQALANRIAERIANWIKNGDILKSHNRPIQAGDIMILVRRRNALVEHLLRALKIKNVPVSGADRLVISNHIAVKDVLAALAFTIMPEDDLTLACLLKSPLIGWDDETLEEYAFDREGSLWHEIKNRAPEAIKLWLSRLIETMSGKNAFSAVSHILNSKSAEPDLSGWNAFVKRLGDECIDPLEELLNMAQNFDANHAGAGIQGFLHTMETNQSDIKRELDNADDKVRIMTVHASKGLQAPIVFLPDTTALPTSMTSDNGLLWTEDDLPLWSPSSGNDNDLITNIKQIYKAETLDEYYRLLYVAMTRAEDRLIICGTLDNNKSSVSEGTWYQCVENGMVNIGSTPQEWPDDTEYLSKDNKNYSLVYETAQTAQPKDSKQVSPHTVSLALPEWVMQPIGEEHEPPRVLKPSQDDSADIPVRSPLNDSDDSYRFRRGLLTHSLLQYLPDISHEKRKSAGQAYLDKQAPDISDDMRRSILLEVMDILTNPDFAPFFGEGSLAEVPVTGVIKRETGKTDIISGQIDRLLIKDGTVWIIDFKSNRPPPRNPDDVPAQYQKQLSAYKTLIQAIYPDHNIRCALLWTDGPFMTELKDV